MRISYRQDGWRTPGFESGYETREWFCAANYHHRYPADGDQIIVLCLSLA